MENKISVTEVKRRQTALIEKAKDLKLAIERQRSRGTWVMVARYERELEDLRIAYRITLNLLEDLASANG